MKKIKKNNSGYINPPSGDGGIKVGIIGGAGYTGGELIRLLINHPNTEIVFVNSKSNAEKHLHEVHKDLIDETSLKFSSKLDNNIDVLFLCVGHGAAKKFLEENEIDKKTRVIDLSQDFRLHPTSDIKHRTFVYGLPEINREQIRSSHNIANPGCFATAIELGLLPLANAGLLTEVHTTGITGSTGAGQGLSETSHFSWRENNIQAYKTLTHQHLGEIYQSLHQLQNSFPTSPSGDGGVNFVPWRGDFTRGIFVSSQMNCDWELKKLIELYEEFYAQHPFTTISKDAIFLKQVVNTNKCIIQLEKAGNKLVIHSAIDNLLKGASGQALQNMNLMFGVDETTGLKLKANAF
jgi:N-acetyl-gamma-glutamyl-phosphate reductase